MKQQWLKLNFHFHAWISSLWAVRGKGSQPESTLLWQNMLSNKFESVMREVLKKNAAAVTIISSPFSWHENFKSKHYKFFNWYFCLKCVCGYCTLLQDLVQIKTDYFACCVIPQGCLWLVKSCHACEPKKKAHHYWSILEINV